MTRRTTLFLLLAAGFGGCSAPEKPSLYSHDPSLKIPAMKSAELSDLKAVKELVKDLDSDDPAVRFYAIERLHEITGKTFGYRYYDDEIERKAALKEWKQWLAEREGTTKPTTQEK